MLVLEGVTRRFGGKAAVAGVDLRIESGSFVGVIGRSGAGKSTLLRMLNRLVDPSEGRILHDGVEVSALNGRALRAWRARCAMIFQQFNLVGRLDVLTNVLTGRLNHMPAAQSLLRLWSEADRAIALSAFEQFDIISTRWSSTTAADGCSSAPTPTTAKGGGPRRHACRGQSSRRLGTGLERPSAPQGAGPDQAV